MIRKGNFESAIVTAILLIFVVTNVKAQNTLIDSLFKENAYSITWKNGDLSDNGMDFIKSSIKDTQFFAFAEWHGSNEIPKITSQLFKLLHKNYGFNHVALENGPVILQMLAESARKGGLSAVIELMRKYPKALAFRKDQELELITPPYSYLDQDLGSRSTLLR